MINGQKLEINQEIGERLKKKGEKKNKEAIENNIQISQFYC
jgi:hypothetical protein